MHLAVIEIINQTQLYYVYRYRIEITSLDPEDRREGFYVQHSRTRSSKMWHHTHMSVGVFAYSN